MSHGPEMAGIRLRQYTLKSNQLNTPGTFWNFPSENTGSHFFAKAAMYFRLAEHDGNTPKSQWFIIILPIKIAIGLVHTNDIPNARWLINMVWYSVFPRVLPSFPILPIINFNGISISIG